MRSFRYVFLALRSLRAHMLRSILAVIGIVIGIAAVLIVVALAEGARGEITRQIDSLGSNLLLIQPGAQVVGGVRLPEGTMLSLTTADALALTREIPAVEIAAPFVGQHETAIAGDSNWSTLVAGVTPEYFEARGWTSAQGQLLTPEDVKAAAKAAVIGHRIAHELFRDGEAIGRFVRIGLASYAVTGVLAEKGQDFTGRDQDDVVFIPLSSAKIFAIGRSPVNPQSVHSILLRMSSGESMGAAEDAVSDVLRRRHKIAGDKADDFRIQNLVQIAQTRDRAYRQFTMLVSALAGVSLLVGGIGVMNIMLVSVAERTNEIGMRLAFGARARDIRRQFLTEAGLLCTIGGLLGLAVGYGFAHASPSVLNWPVEFNGMMALITIGCSSAIGIVFGLLPAERAARLHPATVLRSTQ